MAIHTNDDDHEKNQKNQKTKTGKGQTVLRSNRSTLILNDERPPHAPQVTTMIIFYCYDGFYCYCCCWEKDVCTHQ